jgi:hypothetical protein
MKQIILIASVLITLSSCKKEVTNPQNTSTGASCSSINSMLTTGEWIPMEDPDIFAVMRYDTDGKYYENGNHDGQWSLTQNCDSINYTTNNNYIFKDYIVSITSDTLIMEGFLGQLKYHH